MFINRSEILSHDQIESVSAKPTIIILFIS